MIGTRVSAPTAHTGATMKRPKRPRERFHPVLTGMLDGASSRAHESEDEEADDQERQPDQDVLDVWIDDAADRWSERRTDRDPEGPVDERRSEDRRRELAHRHVRRARDQRHHHARSWHEPADEHGTESMAVDALGPDVDLDRVDVHPARQPVNDRDTET